MIFTTSDSRIGEVGIARISGACEKSTARRAHVIGCRLIEGLAQDPSGGKSPSLKGTEGSYGG